MKTLLIVATLSLGTIAPCFAQKTLPAQPFLSSYDELHEAQQKEIMRTWNVVPIAQPFLSSYDELHKAQQNKLEREWNALEVVRATTAPEVSGERGASQKEVTESAPLKDYLDQNVEQINMNTAIKSAIEVGN
jgi:hypothetical protein